MSIALTIFSGDGYRLSQPAPERSSTRRVACIRGRGPEALSVCLTWTAGQLGGR